MAPLDSEFQHQLRGAFVSAQEDVRHGVSTARAASTCSQWKHWKEFCSLISIDPTLQPIKDPIVFLQIYAKLYRHGKLSFQREPVRSRTVEDALRKVGQTISSLGATDPREDDNGKIDFRIQRQLRCYKKEDPPPSRVKPVPFQVLENVMAVALESDCPKLMAIADMMVLAYFFLLRPGEYTANPSDSTPFRLCDVGLLSLRSPLDALTCPFHDLQLVDFVTLEFTKQKNAVEGEVIGLGKSYHPTVCPVSSLIRRIKHLRTNNAPSTTPLSHYFDNGKWCKVLPKHITTHLRRAVTFLGPSNLGFTEKDVEARSLRAAGAMALLCAQVDSDKIRLLGRWHSDEMFRYLHVQAQPLMKDFAKLMVSGGNFILTPNHMVPMHA